MSHGSIKFAFDAGDGLEEELAKVAKGGCRLMGDALFGESGEDFAEDVVYVRDGVELAGTARPRNREGGGGNSEEIARPLVMAVIATMSTHTCTSEALISSKENE
jgi:hypothetical protein